MKLITVLYESPDGTLKDSKGYTFYADLDSDRVYRMVWQTVDGIYCQRKQFYELDEINIVDADMDPIINQIRKEERK